MSETAKLVSKYCGKLIELKKFKPIAMLTPNCS